MRKSALLLSSMLILSQLAASKLSAQTITYDFVDYPSIQGGFDLSGSITTDGTIGDLGPTNILSWSWQAQMSGEVFGASSPNSVGSIVFITGDVTATPTEIYLLPSADSTENSLDLQDYQTESGLNEYRDGQNVYSQMEWPLPNGFFLDRWFFTGPTPPDFPFGPDNSFVLATTVVPEPSSFILPVILYLTLVNPRFIKARTRT